MPQDANEQRETAENAAVSTGNGLMALLKRALAPGLSVKLLLLTVMFVLLAEVLIFVPSVANFRVNWLTDRLVAARLAALAAKGSTHGQVPPDLRLALLSMAQVKAVAIKRDNQRLLVLPPQGPISIDQTFDLTPKLSSGFLDEFAYRVRLIRDALAVFVTPDDRTIRIIGLPETAIDLGLPAIEFVEIVIPESMLRAAMVGYALNIMLLSIVISLIVAALLYVVLDRLLVTPMRRIARNMLHFASDPEDPSRTITPTRRGDEIGTAERELQQMQLQLQQMLHQKNRLAQLGLAVSKINHDLRNMLASAQLISDRLSTLPDPTVQRFAPKLIASLDRAIKFCNDTIRFGRAEEAPPRRSLIPLGPLVEEIGEGLGLPHSGLHWRVDVDEALRIDADRDQLHRILDNIIRNSMQAIEAQGGSDAEIRVRARRASRGVVIEIADTGPGLPARAKTNLFQAFQGAARRGGTGLGLAITHELVSAHGGTIELVETERGAAFRLMIPDRLALAA